MIESCLGFDFIYIVRFGNSGEAWAAPGTFFWLQNVAGDFLEGFRNGVEVKRPSDAMCVKNENLGPGFKFNLQMSTTTVVVT